MIGNCLRSGGIAFLVVTAAASQVLAAGQVRDKPNFLWLVSEDNSRHYLRLYDEQGAVTPTIDSLADQGLVFDNAFSNAPVCSVARTTLATGAYGPRTATQYHRAYRLATLPEDLEPVSKILKDHGYYTTNRHKEDYNFRKRGDVWSESSQQASWRNRKDGQSFFHMQSWGVTHEAALHFPESDVVNGKTSHEPDSLKLPAIYPDTPTFRYTYAFYLDRQRLLDEKLGEVIAALDADGELENTFIFYFGDHGGVLPGSKGYLYETGLNIPLVVRIPRNFAHLVGPGLRDPQRTRVKGFVSFVDFAPTLLELAGLAKSAQHDGHAFLSPSISLDDLNERDVTLGYADRFDEKMDLVRSVRKGRYKYIRNFQPFYPDALYNDYRFKQAAYREWKRLYEEGTLDGIAARFFEKRPPEVLYDIEVDPYETNNLAGSAEYADIVVELRQELTGRLKNWPDLSFLPEAVIQREAVDDPVSFARVNKARIGELIEIADLQLLKYKDAKPALRRLLKDDDPWVRYWALINMSHFATAARCLAPEVHDLLVSEKEPLVRARAYEFLALAGDRNVRDAMQELIDVTEDAMALIEILNIAANMRESYGYTFTLGVSDDLTDVRDVRYWFQSRKAYLED